MKPTRLFFAVVWLALAVELGQSIMCFSCGFSESNEVNATRSCESDYELKDCSLDPEFGEHYDSCFSQVFVVQGKPKIQIRECAMYIGCEELGKILCNWNSVEDSEKSLNQSCKVECCKEDYCNDFLVSKAYAFSGSDFLFSSMAIKTIMLSTFFAVVYVLDLFEA